MTKEELYEEFKEVTHFDDTDLDITVSKITNIEMWGNLIAHDFEGICIKIGLNIPQLTYFHKEANHVDKNTEQTKDY